MSKFKNLALGIGIVVIFALLLWQGIETFYSTPQYNDFCGEYRTAEFITSPERCFDIGGNWSYFSEPLKDSNSTGYCDVDYTCRNNYESALDSHSKIVFIIALVIGLIAIGVGYFVLSVEPIGSSLIGSGVWAIFWGSLMNWRNFSSIWRFLLLLIAFIFVVYLTFRLNNKRKK